MSAFNSPHLRVMLLDDHVLVRRGMASLLTRDYGVEVAGSFCTPRQLFEGLKATCPDVIVTDCALGSADMDGVKLIRSLRQHHPDVRILVVSSHSNPATVALAV